MYILTPKLLTKNVERNMSYLIYSIFFQTNHFFFKMCNRSYFSNIVILFVYCFLSLFNLIIEFITLPLTIVSSTIINFFPFISVILYINFILHIFFRSSSFLVLIPPAGATLPIAIIGIKITVDPNR